MPASGGGGGARVAAGKLWVQTPPEGPAEDPGRVEFEFHSTYGACGLSLHVNLQAFLILFWVSVLCPIQELRGSAPVSGNVTPLVISSFRASGMDGPGPVWAGAGHQVYGWGPCPQGTHL